MLMVMSGFKEADDKAAVNLELHDAIADAVVPKEFKCPISKKLMKDHAVLSTGVVHSRFSLSNKSI